MTQRRPFPKGSFVVLYSDGITEAENVAGDEFENDRLEAVLREHIDATPAEICDSIAAAVETFAAGAPQKDDQTIVVARRQGAVLHFAAPAAQFGRAGSWGHGEAAENLANVAENLGDIAEKVSELLKKSAMLLKKSAILLKKSAILLKKSAMLLKKSAMLLKKSAMLRKISAILATNLVGLPRIVSGIGDIAREF
jgi:hypothetical protein